MNILLQYHIRKEDEKYSLDEKCWTIYPPPKLPSPTYPQIVFGNLLPFKCEVFEYIVLNIKNS